MKRTLAIALATGLGASAFGSVTIMDGGLGTVHAGAEFQNFNVPVPSNVNVVVNDPTANTTANVTGSGTSNAGVVCLDVDFEGAGAVGDARMTFSTAITIDEAVDLHINGTLAGLSGYELIFRPTDHSFQIREYLDYDEWGFFGTLTDDDFNPVPGFNVYGQLLAGTYELLVTMRAEALDGVPFDGAGGFTVTLTSLPAPSAAFALGAPALLLTRRRRG